MKLVRFIYQWLIAIPILVIITFFVALFIIIACTIFHADKCAYYIAKFWGKCWCVINFVRVTVKNRELVDSQKSYVFVANHQSAFDIFSIYGYLNHSFKWMMKKSLIKIPMVGYACKSAGHIFVDKSSAKAIQETIEQAKKSLVKGGSLVIFPEGARTFTGEMSPFKRGAFKLATEFSLPIVPVTITGAFEVMPRTTLNIKPGHIILTIHQPIHPDADGGHDMQQVIDESYNAISSSLHQQ